MRSVQIRVGPGRNEQTQYLQREGGEPNPRSKLQHAIVAIDPGTALVVTVDDAVTVLPWGVVESVGWDEPTS
ncbi:MAG TPA: hypothetical protein VFH97_10695 [Gemmatimonadales bacterium]|nr:hypothetical protein [Gemmatimonadales bacterium]